MIHSINQQGKALCFTLFYIWLSLNLSAQEITEAWITENYHKKEVMIPMRDGICLYTAIYEPLQQTQKAPILMTRTPYKASPYGKKFNNRLWGIWKKYAHEKYIFVIQDVRGRWKSEGEFINVRPFIRNKTKQDDTDEASDVYDTAEWLLAHTHNNGNIGIIGSSYSGFYALMGALSKHPAIKAVVPQAPVTDWFMGDDYHHNGAFMLCDGFRFATSVNRPRPTPTDNLPPAKPYYLTDEYSFFLNVGSLKDLTRIAGDSITYWKELMEHPNYDQWWQERDSRRSCYNIDPAVLIVGGLFDAEDCYGAWELYKAIRKQSPQTDLEIIMGPWHHGAWNGKGQSNLGNIDFGSQTVLYYRNNIEYPFLQYHLNNIGSPTPASQKATVFFSGKNEWKQFHAWPPTDTRPLSFYLGENGTLNMCPPEKKESHSEYISDPDKPVPYTDKTTYTRPKEYMTDDQRFSERRPDVLSFKTEPLKENITLGGAIKAELEVAITTTDADFVVKIIDEYPDDYQNPSQKHTYLMNGYQMLIRGEVMRGRYRNSFEHPEAFTPNHPTRICFSMNDIAHTFKKGHKIVVQIQSSWFPLVDRNPQQFVDIYQCSNNDFIKSTIKVLHQKEHPSRITFNRLN